MEKRKTELQRGQSISFRIPSDTPDHLLKQLQKLKETERRNFSSTIADFVLQGVSRSQSAERETVTIPLPQKLSKLQRDWLKHEHSEALLGSILYQLIHDPVRATALLAGLNSHSSNIDEALYLQEQQTPVPEETAPPDSPAAEESAGESEDDIDSISWEDIEGLAPEDSGPEEEEELEDLLGSFLDRMNK